MVVSILHFAVWLSVWEITSEKGCRHCIVLRPRIIQKSENSHFIGCLDYLPIIIFPVYSSDSSNSQLWLRDWRNRGLGMLTFGLYYTIMLSYFEGPLHKNRNSPDTPSAVWLALRRSTGTDPFTWSVSGSIYNDDVQFSNDETRLCAAYNYFTNTLTALNCTDEKRRNILCESGIL